MAPLPDLPPMPPVPDEEMARFRRPSQPDRAAQSTSPDPVDADRNVVTVRFNRRLLWWVVSIGWPLSPVMFVLGVYLHASIGMESQLLFFALHFPPLYAAMMGTYLLAQGDCLTYDVRRGWVGGGVQQIRSARKRWREGDRFEYSIYLGRLELVRANGRRRGLFRNGFILDRASWTAFVDVFLAHQNARAADRRDAAAAPEVHGPAGSPVEPESAVSVGIRWRFFVVILLIGLGCMAVDVAFLNRTADDFAPVGPLGLAAGGYLLFGAIPLLYNPVLAYGSGQVSVKARGLPARRFPRPDGERLEYSVYTGILYEVRADGRRRRVATGWARDQDAWKTFVDRFMRDHPVPAAESGEQR